LALVHRSALLPSFHRLEPGPPEPDEKLDAAVDELSASLAAHAPERDDDRLERLRRFRPLQSLPAELRGPGASLTTVYSVVRRIARVDPSTAILLGPDAGALGRRLTFVNLYVGLAEGALLAVRDHLHPQTTEDPYLLSEYGEQAAHVQAAAALADHAVAALEWARSREAELTEQKRGELSALIVSAEIVSTQAALEATAQILDLTGERVSRLKSGLDRFWRAVRTHGAVAYRQEELGRFFLTDATAVADEVPLAVSRP
jgi:alkylation response protein AidB-like acyl-CoA dehydrogenase